MKDWNSRIYESKTVYMLDGSAVKVTTNLYTKYFDFGVVDEKGRKIGATARVYENSTVGGCWYTGKDNEDNTGKENEDNTLKEVRAIINATAVQSTRDGNDFGAYCSAGGKDCGSLEDAFKDAIKKVEASKKRVLKACVNGVYPQGTKRK